MNKYLEKFFGSIKLSWRFIIVFAGIMGLYTALMAMLTPSSSSFHDIAVTVEWWILPTIFIIVNSDSPLSAAKRTFVFFLISQPLVYLIQVPFSNMGWGLFAYYRYWFMITLLTFPGAYLGWYIKKDKWYSGLILSVMTVLLVVIGTNYAYRLIGDFPNHLLSAIYCYLTAALYIIYILHKKTPRLIASIITLVALVVCLIIFPHDSYIEATDFSFLSENNITFSGEVEISSCTTDQKTCGVEINKTPDGEYSFHFRGRAGEPYHFTLTDSYSTYSFTYYFEDKTNNLVVNYDSSSREGVIEPEEAESDQTTEEASL